MAAGYAIVNKDVGRHHPIITDAGTSHHRASRTSPVRQRQYIATPPIAPSINTHRNNCSITQEYMRHRFSRMNADYPSCSVKICGSFWTISFAFGRMPLEVPQRARLACSLHVDGPIAQSVEQLAFNQWVAGSSPARLKTLYSSRLKPGRMRQNINSKRRMQFGRTVAPQPNSVVGLVRYGPTIGGCRCRSGRTPAPGRR